MQYNNINDAARYVINRVVESRNLDPSDYPYSSDITESLNQITRIVNPNVEPASTIADAFVNMMISTSSGGSSSDSSLNDSLNDGARDVIDLLVEHAPNLDPDEIPPYSADALESLNQILILMAPDSVPAPTIGAAFRAIMGLLLHFDGSSDSDDPLTPT